MIVLRDGVKLLGLHVSDKASNATDTPTTNPELSSADGSMSLPLGGSASNNNSNVRNRSHSMSYGPVTSRRASLLSSRSMRGAVGGPGVAGGSSQYSAPSHSETSSQGMRRYDGLVEGCTILCANDKNNVLFTASFLCYAPNPTFIIFLCLLYKRPAHMFDD